MKLETPQLLPSCPVTVEASAMSVTFEERSWTAGFSGGRGPTIPVHLILRAKVMRTKSLRQLGRSARTAMKRTTAEGKKSGEKNADGNFSDLGDLTLGRVRGWQGSARGTSADPRSSGFGGSEYALVPLVMNDFHPDTTEVTHKADENTGLYPDEKRAKTAALPGLRQPGTWVSLQRVVKTRFQSPIQRCTVHRWPALQWLDIRVTKSRFSGYLTEPLSSNGHYPPLGVSAEARLSGEKIPFPGPLLLAYTAKNTP
ncbi:hypothetical protein DFH06DRAFT_1432424 [Mycena polygramma]|nr:hypothetical protein DFH06DRAFT_1432424 [Mycena polygramma]